jgi:hypothetical protein
VNLFSKDGGSIYYINYRKMNTGGSSFAQTLNTIGRRTNDKDAAFFKERSIPFRN